MKIYTRHLIRSLVFASAVLLAPAAFAGTANGKVTRIFVLACPSATAQAGCAIGIVKLTALISGGPACANNPGEWAFALDTVAGKAMFNAILHAQAVGALVSIVGDGTCGAWFDRERPYYTQFDYPN
jgi:hypothetical protein